MALTYRELRDKLNDLDEEVLPLNVSVLFVDEMYEIESLEINEGECSSDIIDAGHPYLLLVDI